MYRSSWQDSSFSRKFVECNYPRISRFLEFFSVFRLNSLEWRRIVNIIVAFYSETISSKVSLANLKLLDLVLKGFSFTRVEQICNYALGNFFDFF